MRLALALLLAAVGCTTSFDLGELPRGDAGAASCGAANGPCCATTPACAAGTRCEGGRCLACPGSLFACGDACVDPLTNAAHCGACGNRCAEGFDCVGGGCALRCPAPLTPCGGRCASLDSDPAHCGACGSACAPANALARCEGGRCAVGSCAPGYGDCDGDATNGCEIILAASAAHCGRCGGACAAPNVATAACVMGACTVGRCVDGFADCNGNPADGCEVDTRADPLHCGACRSACASGAGSAVCRSGSCVTVTTTCPAGRADCDGDGVCETDTSRPESCGRCGNRCVAAHGEAACAMTANGPRCAIARCATGFEDCDGEVANGCEADVRNDPRRCGGCGRVCAVSAGAAGCVNGACVVASCAPGLGDCDRNAQNGCETALATSTEHCGACGSRCAAPGAITECREGRCAITGCVAGRADCNNNPADGCEVDTRSSSNCGRCGNACPATGSAVAHGVSLGECAEGRCRLRCDATWADCDGDASNGCEADLTCNPRHCGACGVSCAGTATGDVCCGSRCGVSIACNLASYRCR